MTANPSKCCKAPLAYETLGTVLVFRVENRRSLYRCRCTKCGMAYETSRPSQGGWK